VSSSGAPSESLPLSIGDSFCLYSPFSFAKENTGSFRWCLPPPPPPPRVFSVWGGEGDTREVALQLAGYELGWALLLFSTLFDLPEICQLGLFGPL